MLLLDMIQNEVIDLGCLGSCFRDSIGRELPLSDFDSVVANKYTCDGADCIFVFDKAAKQLRMDRDCVPLWQLNMDTQWSVAQMVLRMGETLFISINTDPNTLFFDEAALTTVDINKSPSILAVRAGYRLHARRVIAHACLTGESNHIWLDVPLPSEEDMEQEAVNYAEELLIPQDRLFLALNNFRTISVPILAQLFMVSEEFMTRRMRRLLQK